MSVLVRKFGSPREAIAHCRGFGPAQRSERDEFLQWSVLVRTSAHQKKRVATVEFLNQPTEFLAQLHAKGF
jgi:hypothetical protein